MAVVPDAELVDAVCVVVFDSVEIILIVDVLLFGFVVTILGLAVDLRAVVLASAAFELVVAVVVLDSVGSLKVCGFAIAFTSVCFSIPCSTLILWNVIADVSGNGNVIFGVATFCNVVK